MKTIYEMLLFLIIEKEFQKQYFGIFNENNQELKNAINNKLFGLNGPRQVKIKTTRENHFISNKIYLPFSEILKSRECISNISVYLKYFPHIKSKRIKRSEYLRYHYSNYLNEVYILSLRLANYLKILKRAYGNILNKYQEDKFDKLIININKLFKDQISIRGSHVHQNRYDNEGVDRISFIELLFLSFKKKNQIRLLNSYLLIEYNKLQVYYLKTINNFNKKISVFMGVYFKIIFETITKDCELIYPNNIKI